MQKFSTKLNVTPVKAFNKMKPISGVKQVSNTTSRVDNAKSWAPDIHKGIEDSTLVKSVEYDEEKQELTITFKDGFVAHYPDISKELAQDFVNDESKGRFVWKHLYNHKYY